MSADYLFRYPALTGIVLVGALALGACRTAGDTSGDEAVADTAMVATATETPDTPDAPALGDVIDTAIGAGNFTTLVAAIDAAGLTDTLKGDGPFTVFAPTDEAFAALPAGTVDALLLPDNRPRLIQILTYHVVASEMMSGDIAGQTMSVATVEGREISIDATNGVKVNDATVIAADVEASNGVIHVIDTVLIP